MTIDEILENIDSDLVVDAQKCKTREELREFLALKRIFLSEQDFDKAFNYLANVIKKGKKQQLDFDQLEAISGGGKISNAKKQTKKGISDALKDSKLDSDIINDISDILGV